MKTWQCNGSVLCGHNSMLKGGTRGRDGGPGGAERGVVGRALYSTSGVEMGCMYRICVSNGRNDAGGQRAEWNSKCTVVYARTRRPLATECCCWWPQSDCTVGPIYNYIVEGMSWHMLVTSKTDGSCVKEKSSARVLFETYVGCCQVRPTALRDGADPQFSSREARITVHICCNEMLICRAVLYRTAQCIRTSMYVCWAIEQEICSTVP